MLAMQRVILLLWLIAETPRTYRFGTAGPFTPRSASESLSSHEGLSRAWVHNVPLVRDTIPI